MSEANKELVRRHFEEMRFAARQIGVVQPPGRSPG
jgi:hypothetical protein